MVAGQLNDQNNQALGEQRVKRNLEIFFNKLR